jgi:hypothetical protein
MKPRLYVDFNEMFESDLVLLSKGDTKVSLNGEVISLYDRLKVTVYMDDTDVAGSPDK